jgi:hypothetical protein
MLISAQSLKRSVRIAGYVAAVAVAVLCGWRWWFTSGPASALEAESPNGAYRICLREVKDLLQVDRNFVVSLSIAGTGAERQVFISPDEGRPVGSERFVWSDDSKWVMLAGRHFYVVDGAVLPDGEQMYLLYHVPDGSIWCHSCPR